jgi:hypothetical protein
MPWNYRSTLEDINANVPRTDEALDSQLAESR